MKLSQWFNLLKTFSHDVGIIQCSVNGLIHENLCLQFQKLTLMRAHNMKLSQWFNLLKTFSHDVGIIQCSVNGLIH